MEKIPKVFPRPFILKDFSMRGWSLEATAFGSSVKQEETVECTKLYFQYKIVTNLSIRNYTFGLHIQITYLF